MPGRIQKAVVGATDARSSAGTRGGYSGEVLWGGQPSAGVPHGDPDRGHPRAAGNLSLEA